MLEHCNETYRHFQVHDNAIRLAFNARPGKMILVTDAMAALGLPIGKHRLGEMMVDVEKDRVVLENTDTLAGSKVSLDECVRRVIKSCEVPTVEVRRILPVLNSCLFLLFEAS